MNEEQMKLQNRLDGALRAMAIINTMKPSEFKTKHRSRVFGNLNRIRAAIRRAK